MGLSVHLLRCHSNPQCKRLPQYSSLWICSRLMDIIRKPKKYSFFIPRHEAGAGGIVITMAGVRPCGRASVFRIRSISVKPFAGLLLYCIHTSLRRRRWAFWELRPLTYFLPFEFQAISDFNYLRMISSVSRRYLRNHLLDCFHTAHTHPPGGVHVPFEGYDLWPNFWPLILSRLLTSIIIDCGW